jgi:hypothetical protein
MTKASQRKHAYDTKYESTPTQIAKRSERNQARRQYEKAHGNLPANVDVDHKRALDAGGGNTPSNLRAQPSSINRAWRTGGGTGGQTYTKKSKV